MYNYKHGVEVSHRESIMLPLSLNEDNIELFDSLLFDSLLFDSLFEDDDDNFDLLDLLLGKGQDIIPDHWFEIINNNVSKILSDLPDGELKHQFTIFKAVAEYAYNSNLVESLTYIIYNYEDSSVEMIFSFASHYDSETFLLELCDYLDTI